VLDGSGLTDGRSGSVVYLNRHKVIHTLHHVALTVMLYQQKVTRVPGNKRRRYWTELTHHHARLVARATGRGWLSRMMALFACNQYVLSVSMSPAPRMASPGDTSPAYDSHGERLSLSTVT